MTEKEIIQRLKREDKLYAPLVIKSLEREVGSSRRTQVDAIIKFSLKNGPAFEALVEITSVATPKNVLEKSRLLVECVGGDRKSNKIPLKNLRLQFILKG